MVNKDVTHPRMRRFIRNPRIVLLDCPLEYKKAESQTTLEVIKVRGGGTLATRTGTLALVHFSMRLMAMIES